MNIEIVPKYRLIALKRKLDQVMLLHEQERVVVDELTTHHEPDDVEAAVEIHTDWHMLTDRLLTEVCHEFSDILKDEQGETA